MEIWTTTKSERGFENVDFQDSHHLGCSLQQSSGIDFNTPDGLHRPGTSYVWLGRDDNRMHLDREQVALLVLHLSCWLEYGSFSAPQCIESFDCNGDDHSDACPAKGEA